MSAILEGFGLASKVADLVARFIPDKAQQEKDAFALQLQALVGEQANALAQIEVDKAEAESPDRINHWRGGLGWCIVFAVAWHYLVLPFFLFLGTAFVSFGWIDVGRVPKIPDLTAPELSTLFDLALIMLGAHAVPTVANAVSSFAVKKT